MTLPDDGHRGIIGDQAMPFTHPSSKAVATSMMLLSMITVPVSPSPEIPWSSLLTMWNPVTRVLPATVTAGEAPVMVG